MLALVLCAVMCIAAVLVLIFDLLPFEPEVSEDVYDVWALAFFVIAVFTSTNAPIQVMALYMTALCHGISHGRKQGRFIERRNA